MADRADRYFIFRLVEGPSSRHRRLYLLPGGIWGNVKGRALQGSLRKMRALAKSLKDDFPFLIIERLERASREKEGADAGPRRLG